METQPDSGYLVASDELLSQLDEEGWGVFQILLSPVVVMGREPAPGRPGLSLLRIKGPGVEPGRQYTAEFATVNGGATWSGTLKEVGPQAP